MLKSATGIALTLAVVGLATEDQARTVTHRWGQTTIRGTPSRVVALDFSFIDQLVALGVPPVALGGIGEVRIPEYLSDEVKAFTYVGERKDPDLEIIRS